jgi:cytoskeletal protein RodZ
MSTVGETLAGERRRQGKSIVDVVEGTKIRSRLVEALEDGRWNDLPSEAYVKGYIQSYARFLEIPPGPLLEQYRIEASMAEPRPMHPAERYLNKLPTEPIVAERHQENTISQQTWLVVAGGVVVVLLLIFGISRCSPAKGTTGGLPAVANNQAGQDITASPGATEPTSTTTPVGATFKLRVTVKAGQASFVNVTVDGLTAYDGTLQAGESQEFLVTKSAVLKVAKPSAVTVTKDGAKVTLPTTANAQITLNTGN